MNKLELLNQWASQLSVEDVKNLTEEEILDKVLERPLHPGQYGFIFPLSSPDEFALIFYELMKRLLKIEDLKEKMKGRACQIKSGYYFNYPV